MSDDKHARKALREILALELGGPAALERLSPTPQPERPPDSASTDTAVELMPTDRFVYSHEGGFWIDMTKPCSEDGGPPGDLRGPALCFEEIDTEDIVFQCEKMMDSQAAEVRLLRQGIAETMNLVIFCPWCSIDTEGEPEPHDHMEGCFLRTALDAARQGSASGCDQREQEEKPCNETHAYGVCRTVSRAVNDDYCDPCLLQQRNVKGDSVEHGEP